MLVLYPLKLLSVTITFGLEACVSRSQTQHISLKRRGRLFIDVCIRPDLSRKVQRKLDVLMENHNKNCFFLCVCLKPDC